jgi:hypothetical protein
MGGVFGSALSKVVIQMQTTEINENKVSKEIVDGLIKKLGYKIIAWKKKDMPLSLTALEISELTDAECDSLDALLKRNRRNRR